MNYRDIPAAQRRKGWRNKATPKQLCALDVIVRLWFDLGRPPFHPEISAALGLTSFGGSLADTLELKGYLKRKTPGGPLSLTVKGCSVLRMSHR